VVRRDYTKATDTMTTKTTTAQTEATTLNTNEAFGKAWGADGEVLTYEQTAEAIANRQGWFDTQGRWVNKARLEKEARAMVASK